MAKQIKPKVETEEQARNRKTVESIAKNLAALADTVRALLNGPLKRKTILVLLANASGLPQSTVNQVLEALTTLEKDWLNK